jgi:Tfp pilus assembly protein PilP
MIQVYKKLIYISLIIALIACSGCSSDNDTSTDDLGNYTPKISADKALELAKESETRPVSFGTPTLTKKNNVYVWKIQLTDEGGPNKIAPVQKTTYYTYINAENGEIV